MKKYIAIALCLLISATFLYSQERIQVIAIRGTDSDFPDDGFYARASIFPRNSIVELQNPENGRQTEVEIVNSFSSPGNFIALSDKAAEALGLSGVDPMNLNALLRQSASGSRFSGIDGSGNSLSNPSTRNDLPFAVDPDLNPRAELIDPNEFLYVIDPIVIPDMPEESEVDNEPENLPISPQPIQQVQADPLESESSNSDDITVNVDTASSPFAPATTNPLNIDSRPSFSGSPIEINAPVTISNPFEVNSQTKEKNYDQNAPSQPVRGDSTVQTEPGSPVSDGLRDVTRNNSNNFRSGSQFSGSDSRDNSDILFSAGTSQGISSALQDIQSGGRLVSPNFVNLRDEYLYWPPEYDLEEPDLNVDAEFPLSDDSLPADTEENLDFSNAVSEEVIEETPESIRPMPSNFRIDPPDSRELNLRSVPIAELQGEGKSINGASSSNIRIDPPSERGGSLSSVPIAGLGDDGESFDTSASNLRIDPPSEGGGSLSSVPIAGLGDDGESFDTSASNLRIDPPSEGGGSLSSVPIAGLGDDGESFDTSASNLRIDPPSEGGGSLSSVPIAGLGEDGDSLDASGSNLRIDPPEGENGDRSAIPFAQDRQSTPLTDSLTGQEVLSSDPSNIRIDPPTQELPEVAPISLAQYSDSAGENAGIANRSAVDGLNGEQIGEESNPNLPNSNPLFTPPLSLSGNPNDEESADFLRRTNDTRISSPTLSGELQGEESAGFLSENKELGVQSQVLSGMPSGSDNANFLPESKANTAQSLNTDAKPIGEESAQFLPENNVDNLLEYLENGNRPEGANFRNPESFPDAESTATFAIAQSEQDASEEADPEDLSLAQANFRSSNSEQIGDSIDSESPNSNSIGTDTIEGEDFRGSEIFLEGANFRSIDAQSSAPESGGIDTGQALPESLPASAESLSDIENASLREGEFKVSLEEAELRSPGLNEDSSAFLPSEVTLSENDSYDSMELISALENNVSKVINPTENLRNNELLQSQTDSENFPFIESLEENRYYLQLGVFANERNVERVITQVANNYPLAVQPLEENNKKLYRVFVGPLNADERGTVLYWFKAKGFQNSFLRKGT